MTLKPNEIGAAREAIEAWVRDPDLMKTRALSESPLTEAEESLCDSVETIRKALELAQQMQWRDISTAPKDGTLILIRINKQWIASTRWIKTPKGECWDYGLSETKPTHWMPLPEQPSKGDG